VTGGSPVKKEGSAISALSQHEGLEHLRRIAAWQAEGYGRRECAETAADGFPAVPLRIVALVPAYNEEAGIAGTIRALLGQTRPLDDIIIIVNGKITDATLEIALGIARLHPVVRVLNMPENRHRKSGAMNLGWHQYARDADIIVCADGDTVLPPFAVEDWEREFIADPGLGGSSSQPVMTGYGFLPRLQRFEFTMSATQSLNRKWARVVSGTGCAYRNRAIAEIAGRPGQPGPWTYESVVEDYHLTFQLRKAGWLCAMSPTVYCYTGSMKTVKALWHQRIKWQAGTAGDLIKFGFNRLNYREWFQQSWLLFNLAFWIIWPSVNVTEAVVNGYKVNWLWQGMLILLVAAQLIHLHRQRGHDWAYDWKDVLLTVTLVYVFAYNILSLAWGLASWWKVLFGKMGDLWTAQYRAEGMAAVEEQKIGIGS
jgi:poly-beta-1,6-N-acetyl-D-glucosamine synthase